MTTHIQQRQQGAVLIVALIFLVILTMLGVTAMTGTTMELRMAGNTRDLGIALHAAEAAVRDAENDIWGKTYPGQDAKKRNPPMLPVDFGLNLAPGTCNTGPATKGLCQPVTSPQGAAAQLPRDLIGLPALVPAITLSVAANNVQYGDFTGATALPSVALQPRYFLESFCNLTKADGSMGSQAGPPCKYYRITARGYGANPNSRVTLSEVFTLH